MRYIIITGGVISGLGKGITASSIGLLLKYSGYKTTMIKIDPYLNIDAGTMSPYEHGEVFILDDGTETDLDLGNYERFLNIKLTGKHNITSGKVYQSVIEDERKGVYLGKTVQIIPHITNKIKSMIKTASIIPVDSAKCIPEICIIEIGGTIGDIESMHFIEAIRQLKFENNNDNFCFVHVTLVTKTSVTQELKTKPTQNSIKSLRQQGIFPDIMVIRCKDTIDDKIRKKLSMFTEVSLNNIIVNPDVNTIYKVPAIFYNQNIVSIISKKLLLQNTTPDISFLHNIYNYQFKSIVKIAIVGKYTGLADSYLSILRALDHSGIINKCKIEIVWISSEILTENEWNALKYCKGVIIPGGFGVRGIEGMINVASYCRNNKKPLLGICLGMQIICIESARNLLDNQCNSLEFDNTTKHPVIIPIETLRKDWIGGTMKLGLHKTIIKKNSFISKIYNSNVINERHRHRYEVNLKYVTTIENDGLNITGTSEDKISIDTIEDNTHPFYIGCQFHPEFLSTLEKSAPLFVEFIKKCINPLEDIFYPSISTSIC
jgi:CTP synthase